MPQKCDLCLFCTNVTANIDLGRRAKKPWFYGRNYRSEWTEEIQNVPVFDIGQEKGGLRFGHHRTDRQSSGGRP